MSWGRKRVGVWGWKPGPLTWRIIPVCISKYLGSPHVEAMKRPFGRGRGLANQGYYPLTSSGMILLSRFCHEADAWPRTLRLLQRGAPNPRCYTAALRSAPWRSAVEVMNGLFLGWVGGINYKTEEMWERCFKNLQSFGWFHVMRKNACTFCLWFWLVDLATRGVNVQWCSINKLKWGCVFACEFIQNNDLS